MSTRNGDKLGREDSTHDSTEGGVDRYVAGLRDTDGPRNLECAVSKHRGPTAAPDTKEQPPDNAERSTVLEDHTPTDQLRSGTTSTATKPRIASKDHINAADSRNPIAPVDPRVLKREASKTCETHNDGTSSGTVSTPPPEKPPIATRQVSTTGMTHNEGAVPDTASTPANPQVMRIDEVNVGSTSAAAAPLDLSRELLTSQKEKTHADDGTAMFTDDTELKTAAASQAIANDIGKYRSVRIATESAKASARRHDPSFQNHVVPVVAPLIPVIPDEMIGGSGSDLVHQPSSFVSGGLPKGNVMKQRRFDSSPRSSKIVGSNKARVTPNQMVSLGLEGVSAKKGGSVADLFSSASAMSLMSTGSFRTEEPEVDIGAIPSIGALVRAKFHGKGRYAEATVIRDRGDQTYDIVFKNGERESRVPQDSIWVTKVDAAEHAELDAAGDGHSLKKPGSLPPSRKGGGSRGAKSAATTTQRSQPRSSRDSIGLDPADYDIDSYVSHVDSNDGASYASRQGSYSSRKHRTASPRSACEPYYLDQPEMTMAYFRYAPTQPRKQIQAPRGKETSVRNKDANELAKGAHMSRLQPHRPGRRAQTTPRRKLDVAKAVVVG